MDNRRTIITVVLLLILVLTWDRLFIFIGTKLGYDMSAPIAQAQQQAPATAPAATIAAGPLSTQPTSMSAATAPVGLAVVDAGDQARGSTLGSSVPKDSTYAMAVSISPRGAGFNSVILNDYRKSVSSQEPYIFMQPYEGFETQSSPMSTQSLTVDGQTLDLSTANWRLIISDPRSATYELDVAEAGKPAVRLTKTFQVFERKDVTNGSGWEVEARQSVDNLTAHAISVSSEIAGPTTPPREQERAGDRQVISGYLRDEDVTLAHHTVEEFVKDRATMNLSKGDSDSPLAWGGTCSAYFDAIVRPLALPNVAQVTRFSAQSLDLDPDAKERCVSTSFDIAATIPAGGSSVFPVRIFLGPKLRSVLKSDYYAKPPLHYDSTLVMTGGACAFITSDFLITVLVTTLGFFHSILRDWGLAIIALVCLVRACLHPIMKRSQANMMRMGKMGPEIERLKKKYGDDKDALSKAQMELMKEQGFTPILGCLPMFLQIPIFIALWSCLQSTFELRHAPFLWGFTWVKDLAQPDHLLYFPSHPISFLFIHFDALNLLPLCVAVVSFINQKVTPKPPATTPEAQQQQQMMQWMTLVFPLMFYNLPSGLNLYYVTSTSIGILEGKIIRRHIKEKEEAEKAGRVIIDAKPTRASKQAKPVQVTRPQQPKTGLMGWIAELQERAEQLRQEAERRKKP